MPGVLTQTSILLLARARLSQMAHALRAKLARPGAHLTDLDHRVLFLAEKALAMMSDGPPPSDLTPPHPLAEGISKFAVMGSAGPNIPAASAVLADGHEWIYRTLHKGTPDGNREQVVARSTDFVLALVRHAADGISHLPGPSQPAALQAMRAYVLGHLCHVAAAVVGNPWMDDLEDHLELRAQPGFPFGARGPIDARVAVQVLGVPGPREGQNWKSWWPTPDEVPPVFYEAFRQAFEEVYGARRITGSAEFEESFAHLAPPALSRDLLRDGYDFYYHGILGMGYGFGFWNWALIFVPVVAIFALELVLFPLLPHAHLAFTRPPWSVPSPDGERALFELLAFPLLLSAPAALFYGFSAAALTNRGVGGLTVFGIIAAFVELAGLVGFLGTLGTANRDFSSGLRWLLLFAVPVAAPVVFFILYLTRPGQPIGALELLDSVPLLLTVASAVLYFLLFLPTGAASAALGAGTGGLIADYVIAAVLALAGVVVLWLHLARYIRNSILPEMTDETIEQRRALVPISLLPTDRRHLVRLFEDTTLWHDAALAPAAADRKAQFFPSDRRKLIKLWWEPGAPPAGDVFVRSDRFQLVFAAAADGSGPAPVVLPAPVVPSTAAEYVAFLNGAAIALAGVTGQLKAALVYPADLDYELPPGATFADAGDGEATTAAHDRAASRFVRLGHAGDDSAYVLYHAPRAAQSVHFGSGGAVPLTDREEEIAGEGTIASHGTTVTGTGSLFRIFFRVGDLLRAGGPGGPGGQTRAVTLVSSDTTLTVASAFSPELPDGTAYVRVGGERERREGYAYVSDPAGGPTGGESLMDYAADLGALLAMAAVPHLLPAAERTLGGALTAGIPGGPAVAPVYQVFRNWNLDRRRVNEWRLLVAGRSLSEKHGDSQVYDAAMTAPRDAAYNPRQNDDGERAAERLGWVGLLRRWIALAPQAAADPLDATVPAGPGGVSNRDLSRAMAFLLDLPEPAAMP